MLETIKKILLLHNLKHIRDKILFVVFVVLILQICVSTYSDIVFSRNKLYSDLNAKGLTLTDLLEQAILVPLWNFDMESIVKIGESLFSDAEVVYVKVKDGRERIYYEKGEKAESDLTFHSDVVRNGYNMGYFEIAISTDIIAKETNRIILNSLSKAVILFLILGCILYFLINHLFNPLKEIGEIIKKVAKGNYKVRAAVYSEDDIGLLAKIINQMLTQLEENIEIIKNSEERLRTLIDNIPGAVFRSEGLASWKIVHVSNYIKEIVGYSAEEILHDNNLTWNRFILPEYREKFNDLAACSSNNAGYLELECQVYHLDGSVRWILLRGKVLKNTNTINLDGVITDITEKKRVQLALEQAYENQEIIIKERTEELNKAMNVIIETEKMVFLGEIVAGVAHEINTPIGVGVTTASHLQQINEKYSKKFEEKQMSKKDLGHYFKEVDDIACILNNNLKRASQLISSFKRIAIDQNIDEIQNFNFKNYLGVIVNSLKHVYKNEGHQVHVKCPDDFSINSYPSVFSQIFTNLIMNSIIHGFAGIKNGRIDIIVNTNKKEVHIDYTDDGRGMKPEVVAKIFKIFFTTNKHQGGSGLGMNVVYNLVNLKLNGTIVCESEPGKGTCFIIKFPLKMR